MTEDIDPHIAELNDKLFEASSVEEAEKLISEGAQITAKQWTGDTLLHEACSKGNLDLTKFYLSKGFSVDSVGSFGRTPLFAAVSSGGDVALPLCELLVLRHAAKVNFADSDQATPLHIAALNTGSWEVAEFLIAHGADIHAVDKKMATPFLVACGFAGSGLHAARQLVKLGANMTAKDSEGNTALHLACWAPLNKENLVKWLVQSLKFNIDSQNNNGKTPLMMAAGYGASWASPPVMRYLLHKGADLHARTKNEGTILHVAVEFGAADMNVLRFLVDKLGCDVNQADNDGVTPLQVLVGRNGFSFEAFKFLVDRGANVNATANNGNSILHTVAQYAMFYRADVVHVLKYLLDKGANLDVKNNEGLTPLAISELTNWSDFKEALETIQAGNYEKDESFFEEQELQDEEEEVPDGELHPDLQDYVDSDTEA